MNVLLLGSGGREHALAWKIAQSPLLSCLYALPGNPGIEQHAQCLNGDLNDISTIPGICQKKGIDLVVSGPEGPLVSGIGDVLEEAGILFFGPSKFAAQLEGSKSFTKELCQQYSIPSADFRCFTCPEEARSWIRHRGTPLVIKADGLAAGKGVSVAMSMEEALQTVDFCFSGAFGSAGKKIVVEEFLEGEEVSFFCLCNGTRAVAFGSAEDHKRVGDGDRGPNTGGMGAFSPSSLITPETGDQIMKTIIYPTLKGLKNKGFPFSGVLFAGLMITQNGPRLIEYNVRFGDPECQVLMMRLEDDLLEWLSACARGHLPVTPVRWSPQGALCVVLAAQGYPGAVKTGSVIRGLETPLECGVKIFHAGTAFKNGDIISNGGRVLNVTAKAETLNQAREKAYQAVKKIDWPEGFYRSDIGARAG